MLKITPMARVGVTLARSGDPCPVVNLTLHPETLLAHVGRVSLKQTWPFEISRFHSSHS
jgi:hypothetical protein